MQLKLQQLGFAVDHASDGELAMEKMRQNSYDVLLLDLRLPKKNGFEVIKEVRASTALCDMKIFVVSNLGKKEDLAKAIELGADSYFIKAGTNIHDLTEKIAALIG